MVEQFIRSHRKVPEEVILDFDATDDLVQGQQEGRFFHGYYDPYCFLPLYVFGGDQLLVSYLRPSNIDPAQGCVLNGDRRLKGSELRKISEQSLAQVVFGEVVFGGHENPRRETLFGCRGPGARKRFLAMCARPCTPVRHAGAVCAA